MKTYRMTRLFLVFVWLWIITSTGWSQPEVHITGIDSYDFPDVMIEFEVECGGEVRFDLKEKNLTVMEEGKEVDSLRLDCPLPGQNTCCLSAAVLVDRAARFDDSVKYRVRNVLYEFFDQFDGSCDEGTLVTVENLPVVKVFMTNDKELLKNGIDAIYSGTHTALWDGLYSVISELLNNASNSCRDVLFITSGIDDAGSGKTLGDCIRFARDNDIRVFPVAFPGDVRMDTLRAIADATGGRVIYDPGKVDINMLYSAMTTRRCRLQYRSLCADGALRKLELLVGKPEPLKGWSGVGRDSGWFYARTKNRLDVLAMPDSLALDPSGNGLRPNPFFVSYRMHNSNCGVFVVIRSSLWVENADTSEVRIENNVRDIAVSLDKGDSLLISWKVNVMSNRRDRWCSFMVKTMTSNGVLDLRDSVFIPAMSVSAIRKNPEERLFQVGDVYPNPASAGVNYQGFLIRVPISVKKKMAVGFSIIDMMGQEIFEEQPRVFYPGNHIISVPGITVRPGIYLVIIRTRMKAHFRKLLVM